MPPAVDGGRPSAADGRARSADPDPAPARHGADREGQPWPPLGTVAWSWGSWPRRVLVLAVLVGFGLRCGWIFYAARPPLGLHDPFFYLDYWPPSGHRGGGYRLQGRRADRLLPDRVPGRSWPPGSGSCSTRRSPTTGSRPPAALNLIFSPRSIALAGVLGRRLVGPWVGAVTAVIVALFPSLIFHSATILTETTFNFVFLADPAGGLLAARGTRASRRGGGWSSFGLLLGALDRDPAHRPAGGAHGADRAVAGRRHGAWRWSGSRWWSGAVVVGDGPVDDPQRGGDERLPAHRHHHRRQPLHRQLPGRHRALRTSPTAASATSRSERRPASRPTATRAATHRALQLGRPTTRAASSSLVVARTRLGVRRRPRRASRPCSPTATIRSSRPTPPDARQHRRHLLLHGGSSLALVGDPAAAAGR